MLSLPERRPDTAPVVAAHAQGGRKMRSGPCDGEMGVLRRTSACWRSETPATTQLRYSQPPPPPPVPPVVVPAGAKQPSQEAEDCEGWAEIRVRSLVMPRGNSPPPPPVPPVVVPATS